MSNFNIQNDLQHKIFDTNGHYLALRSDPPLADLNVREQWDICGHMSTDIPNVADRVRAGSLRVQDSPAFRSADGRSEREGMLSSTTSLIETATSGQLAVGDDMFSRPTEKSEGKDVKQKIPSPITHSTLDFGGLLPYSNMKNGKEVLPFCNIFRNDVINYNKIPSTIVKPQVPQLGITPQQKVIPPVTVNYMNNPLFSTMKPIINTNTTPVNNVFDANSIDLYPVIDIRNIENPESIFRSRKGISYDLNTPNHVRVSYNPNWVPNIEVVHDITWFQKFNDKKADTNPNIKGRRLIDYVPNWIDKFLISWHYLAPDNKNPGQNYVSRYFAAFDNHISFLNFMAKCDSPSWCFFEVIPGAKCQKPYMDIDIGLEKVPEGRELEEFSQELMEELLDHIIIGFEEITGNVINLDTEIMIFTSHSSRKRSFHIILCGYCVANNYENAILMQGLMEDFPEVYRPFIDSLYSGVQQFRLYLSSKAWTNVIDFRPKILLEEWTFGEYSSVFRYDIDTTVKDPQKIEILKMNFIFQQSIISFTDYTKKIAPVLPELSKLNGDYSSSVKLWSDKGDNHEDFIISDEVRIEACKAVDPETFEVSGISGPIIMLRRLKPSLCPICTPKRKDKRPHENENAFLYVSPMNGNVYFYCWRQKDLESAIDKQIINNVYKLISSKKTDNMRKSLASRFLGHKNKKISALGIQKTLLPSLPIPRTGHNSSLQKLKELSRMSSTATYDDN